LLLTGMRRGEAGSLCWDHVDFTQRIIRLPATATKGKRPLNMPMSDLVRALLIERQRMGRERFVFGSDSRAGYLEDPQHFLNQVCARTGIKVSAHDLRRTYVTVAHSVISLTAIKALVNHSLGGDVTLGYVQYTVEDLREPAQRVANKLKELCGIGAPLGENVVGLGQV
jgi:integrase